VNDDDILLEALGRAFAGELLEQPSPAERQTLRTLVDAQRAVVLGPEPDTAGDDWDQPGGTVIPLRSRSRRIGRRLAIAGLVTAAGLSGATAVAAAANNGVLPNPFRRVVVAVGLPVDSVAVADAKNALRQLRNASDTELPSALLRLERAQTALSPTERNALAAEIAKALADGRQRLAALVASIADTVPATTTTTTATPDPTISHDTTVPLHDSLPDEVATEGIENTSDEQQATTPNVAPAPVDSVGSGSDGGPTGGSDGGRSGSGGSDGGRTGSGGSGSGGDDSHQTTTTTPASHTEPSDDGGDHHGDSGGTNTATTTTEVRERHQSTSTTAPDGSDDHHSGH
jgi:hypothetical protein